MPDINRGGRGEAELEHLLRFVDRAVYESEFEGEAESPNPEVLALCWQAGQIADRLRQARGQGGEIARRAQREGLTWISNTTRAWNNRLGRLDAADLDRLNGCIQRVSSAIAQDPRRLKTFREGVSRRARGLGVRFP
jgi:hypothetical protein